MGIEKHSFVGNPNRQNYVDDEEELLFLSGDEISVAGPDLLIDDTYDVVTDYDDEDYQPDDYEDFISDSIDEYVDDEASESGLEQVFFSDAEQEIPHESLGDSDVEDVQHKTTPDKTENRTNSDIRTIDSGEVDSNQAAGV